MKLPILEAFPMKICDFGSSSQLVQEGKARIMRNTRFDQVRATKPAHKSAKEVCAVCLPPQPDVLAMRGRWQSDPARRFARFLGRA